MAPKVKKAKQTVEKPIEKVIMKKKKKKNYSSFSIYLFKLLRSVNRGKPVTLGISRHSMLIMNNFVNDMVEKIATEAGRLACYGKRNTLGASEIQSATKLLLPGELARHAISEGMKAIAKYSYSQGQSKADLSA